jgi:hypothetical protein
MIKPAYMEPDCTEVPAGHVMQACLNGASRFLRAGANSKSPFIYADCGLDYVYLENGYDVHNTPSGKSCPFRTLTG